MKFTFWNYYVLKLLRLETITFSDATLSDINVVLCYVLSQYCTMYGFISLQLVIQLVTRQLYTYLSLFTQPIYSVLYSTLYKIYFSHFAVPSQDVTNQTLPARY